MRVVNCIERLRDSEQECTGPYPRDMLPLAGQQLLGMLLVSDSQLLSVLYPPLPLLKPLLSLLTQLLFALIRFSLPHFDLFLQSIPILVQHSELT